MAVVERGDVAEMRNEIIRLEDDLAQTSEDLDQTREDQDAWRAKAKGTGEISERKQEGMSLSYDEKADVLYVSLQTLPPGSYQYVENANGDVLRFEKGEVTNHLQGLTIPFFLARLRKGKVLIPEVGVPPIRKARSSRAGTSQSCLREEPLQPHALGMAPSGAGYHGSVS